ncbi:unc-13-4A [Carabus blaptoides fortunei]
MRQASTCCNNSEDVSYRLKTQGENMPDSMLVTKLLMTLPSPFNHFLSAWESTPREQQTLANLTTRLMMEEKRWNLQEKSEGNAFLVLHAKDVIPLDPNGFSDPFVIIELLPNRVFLQCNEQQTNVHKRTLNPIFDECFEFSVSLEQCRSSGAMIAFTVMDHDVLTANDFAGEAFLALGSIPGVANAGSGVDNFHGLKHVELVLLQQQSKARYTAGKRSWKIGRKAKYRITNHLFSNICQKQQDEFFDRKSKLDRKSEKPHNGTNPILQILECRIGDRLAIDFAKKQKLRMTYKSEIPSTSLLFVHVL